MDQLRHWIAAVSCNQGMYRDRYPTISSPTSLCPPSAYFLPFRVAPEHGKNKVINRGNGLVNVLEIHVEEILLRKGSRRCDLEFSEKVVVSFHGWLKHEHASVEVQGRWLTQLFRPLHLVKALLAVTDLVLRAVTPCLLAEAIHYSIELSIWKIKQVIYVLIHLNVSIQVYHLTVLHKLHHNKDIFVKKSDTQLYYYMTKKNISLTYLPDTELGVVDDIIGHGELSLVLRRVNRFDLADYATL